MCTWSRVGDCGMVGVGEREGDVLFSVHISLSFKVDVVVSVGFDINVGVGMEFFSL